MKKKQIETDDVDNKKSIVAQPIERIKPTLQKISNKQLSTDKITAGMSGRNQAGCCG